MSNEDQFDYLLTQGEYLSYRIHCNIKYTLYCLNGNFYEVIYKPDKNHIDEIKKTTIDSVIKCYTDKIKLS